MQLRPVPTAADRNNESPVQVVSNELRSALNGGPPIAPLPAEPAEVQRVLHALRPDEPVEEIDAAVVVATSGSTGEPKSVVLSRTAVIASAEATHERLGGPGTWLLALPVHYVAGLMVLARAIVADTRAHQVGSDLAGVSSALGTNVGRCYLSIVPTQLVRALEDRDLTEQLGRLDAVLLGGAPATPALLDRALTAGLRVVTTYGMSETCGGCVYDGLPLPGVSVQLDETERITLTGRSVFSGYRLRPELTAEALMTGVDGERSFRTQDRGLWREDRLEVLGRFDDVVISGGLNVDLAAVERVAGSAPGLNGGGLAVVAVPDAEWGSRILAVTDRPGLDQAALRAHLRPLLSDHALPRELITLTALPRTSSGKIDRQQLIRDLGSGAIR